jgi:hypothetical protein
MTGQRTPRVGFAPPRPRSRRVTACAALIATVALVVSIAVAATAVSIGISRAAVPQPAVTTSR